MSNYAEDYRMSTDEEKLGILKTLWNKKDYLTEKEKLIILEETQKIYDRLKGRSSKNEILQFMARSVHVVR